MNQSSRPGYWTPGWSTCPFPSFSTWGCKHASQICFFKIYFMCTFLFDLHDVCVLHACVIPAEARRGRQISGTRVANGHEPHPCKRWALNPSPLQEQSAWLSDLLPHLSFLLFPQNPRHSVFQGKCSTNWPTSSILSFFDVWRISDSPVGFSYSWA